MKLISLNVWGGNYFSALVDFLKEQAGTADIFCFQEVLHASSDNPNIESRGARIHLFDELTGLLGDFQGLFDELSRDHDLQGPVDFPLPVGMAMFFKKIFLVRHRELILITGNENDPVDASLHNPPRSLQVVGLRTSQGDLAVCNFHGIPYPGDKLDTQARLQQSQKITEALARFPGPKVLCGDFNLMPETESLRMLESKLNNLIKIYSISNTRNETSWNRYNNRQHFADYTFASPEIKVQSFEVPYNLVSDHLPMILQFNL